MRIFDLFCFKYNRTDFHELNLDWIISDLRTLAETLENFINLNTIKYANPIQWNITTQYEANTVVIDANDGTAYLSVKPVPTGVTITNTDYWTPIFTLNIAGLNDNITLRDDGANVLATFTSVIGDWLILNGTLYKVTQNINVNESYLVGYNIERYTVELFLKDYINNVINIIGDLNDLNTNDKTSVVNSINELVASINSIISDKSYYMTVAEMKSDLTLASGDSCTTLGYNSVGDYGGACYIISATTPSNPYITLDNGLYAEITNLQYLEQIGALHDGATDITSYVNTFATLGIDINLVPQKQYYISDALSLPININFDGHMSILRSATGRHFILADGYYGNVIKNLNLKGGALDEYAINVSRPWVTIENVRYEGADSNFIKLHGQSSGHCAYFITIRDCYYSHTPSTVADNTRRAVYIDTIGGDIDIDNNIFATCTEAIYIEQGANINIRSTNMDGCNGVNFPSFPSSCGIWVNYGRGLNIENNYIENCALGMRVSSTNNDACDINFKGNWVHLINAGAACVRLDGVTNFTGQGNMLKSYVAGAYGYVIGATTKYVYLLNDYFDIANKYGGAKSTTVFLNETIETNAVQVDMPRFKITNLSSNNESVSSGGKYCNTSLSSGSTQTITLSMPQGSIFEFIAHTTLTVIVNATGGPFTKNLTVGQSMKMIVLPNYSYYILD